MGGGVELGAGDEPPRGSSDLLQLGEARGSSAGARAGDRGSGQSSLKKKISRGADFTVLFQKRGSPEKAAGLLVAAVVVSNRRRQRLTVLCHR
ncbi:hypothetical protein MRB53_023127 [Persea americana]|uniref:Uncharacterized protein n=1 Tax=Persea americana TaxID=3435 RepID=A0ACC2L9T4_PERAE|nr:hypothetical protein MRB53_023127 [Persea americana]